jgi:hypothetical protein
VTEQKWRELRVMMWQLQIRIMFALLMRLAERLNAYEKAIRNRYIDVINELNDCGFELEGGV